MYFPFQNCQNLFYRTIIIEMTNKNVKQGSKTLLFPFLTPCAKIGHDNQARTPPAPRPAYGSMAHTAFFPRLSVKLYSLFLTGNRSTPINATRKEAN